MLDCGRNDISVHDCGQNDIVTVYDCGVCEIVGIYVCGILDMVSIWLVLCDLVGYVMVSTWLWYAWFYITVLEFVIEIKIGPVVLHNHVIFASNKGVIQNISNWFSLVCLPHP